MLSTDYKFDIGLMKLLLILQSASWKSKFYVIRWEPDLLSPVQSTQLLVCITTTTVFFSTFFVSLLMRYFIMLGFKTSKFMNLHFWVWIWTVSHNSKLKKNSIPIIFVLLKTQKKTFGSIVFFWKPCFFKLCSLLVPLLLVRLLV